VALDGRRRIDARWTLPVAAHPRNLQVERKGSCLVARRGARDQNERGYGRAEKRLQ